MRRTREAMERVAKEIDDLSPEVLVVVSPHAAISPGAVRLIVAGRYLGDFDAFGVPSVVLSCRGDDELARAIEAQCRALGVPHVRAGHSSTDHYLDHGATVPLYFIRQAGVRARLLLIAFSGLGTDVHRRFGRAIAAASRDIGKRVVLVASGDLSHRIFPGAPAGYSPRGREFDEAIASALRRRDYQAIYSMEEDLLNEAGECGYRSLVIALGALPEADVEVLSYEAPFGVGYLVARFRVPGEPAAEAAARSAERAVARLTEEEAEALRLARLAVESYVREGKVLAAPARPKGLLAESAGVFVSLKVEGQLRGCIGTFQPTEPNIAGEIIRNAIAAATRDPRFPPVEPEELGRLEYSVDVLTPPERVDDLDSLDPKRYGVIVQAGSRRGLLLPDLEGVDSVAMQIDIARRKAGIPAGTPVELYRFGVRRIRE